MPTPDLLVQIASRHAVHLEGLKTGYVGEFERFLQSMQSDIISQIRKIDDPSSLKGRRLNRLLRAVSETLKDGFGNYESVWRKQLTELADYEGQFTIKALGQVVNADFVLPSTEQIMTAAFSRPLNVTGIDEGKLLEPFFRDWTGKTSERVTGAIRLAAAQGQTTPQLVRRLRGTRAAKYRDGILQATRRDVMLMARTALHHIATQTRAVVYEANDDIVRAERFLAVLDGRTSVLCRSLSDKEFPVGKGPQPPLHIACRSARVPVLRGNLELLQGGGKQFSRGEDGVKRVDADLSYFEWLKTQGAEFQDDVIGATRGQLLRKGGLTADRFAELQLNTNFKPMTLAEMRAREPLAFDRAGL